MIFSNHLKILLIKKQEYIESEILELDNWIDLKNYLSDFTSVA